MLAFNKEGLLPEGIHSVSLEEFKKLFGFNSKRTEMIENGLLPVLESLGTQGVKEFFLNGSFVTMKENPDDIDGYVLADTQSELLKFISNNYEDWLAKYRVDLQIAFTDLEGDYSKQWWEEEMFSQIPGHLQKRKGYVVLKLAQKRG